MLTFDTLTSSQFATMNDAGFDPLVSKSSLNAVYAAVAGCLVTVGAVVAESLYTVSAASMAAAGAIAGDVI